MSSLDTLIAVSHQLSCFLSELKSHVISLCHISQRLDGPPTRPVCFFFLWRFSSPSLICSFDVCSVRVRASLPFTIDFIWLAPGLVGMGQNMRLWILDLSIHCKGEDLQLINERRVDILIVLRIWQLMKMKLTLFSYLIVPLPVISPPRMLQHFRVCFGVCAGSRSA